MTGRTHITTARRQGSALRRAWRASVAAACIAVLAVPVGAAPTPAPAAPGLAIHLAQADAFSRLEFRWPAGAQMRVSRTGQVLTIRFSRDAQPDVAVLKTAPLKWVKSVDVKHDHGAIVFVITLTDDADAQTGEADGADFVNIFAKPPAATAAAAPQPQQPAPTRPNPVPQGGVVPVKLTVVGQQARFDFQWANPCGAAVFRRGDAVWIVFDAASKVAIPANLKAAIQIAGVQAYAGEGYTALRITTREQVAVSAIADGSLWSVVLAPDAPPSFQPVKLNRDDSDGPAQLTAAMSGSTAVYWIDDPAVGDKIAVVTALGPVKGVAAPHDFVQFALLQSAQGIAVASHVDDLGVAYNGDIVTISRAKGLSLSPATTRDAVASLDAPKPASMPGLIGQDWSNTGGGSYLARYDALVMPVADEEAKGTDGPSAGHMALARFLIGEGMAFEAIGVLNDALRSHPTLGGESEFRALLGMARVMAGRYKEAQGDLAVPVLADNSAAALWRGYALAKTSQWADARKAFTLGAASLQQFPALWRQRFARMAAMTALATGDVGGAKSWIGFALDNPVDPAEDAHTTLIDAEADQAEGDTNSALTKYQALAKLGDDSVAAPAQLRLTQIQQAQNAITPAQAIQVYDSLRYRWRGDAFELETVRTLGQLYLSQGHYRDALEALRSAGKNLPDLPEASLIQTDLSNAFKTLFLDGMADGLQPVEALGLFYDFKELTPPGADGDTMVRRLVRRLVDVDLLPQAEDLLKYQVDNRLDGVPKAEVATDLAVIYLMDRKPEDALDAINASRTTVLPQPLNLERRVIAARALTGLGRYDIALEMLGADNSPPAMDTRAEIVWDQKAWPQAGAIFEKLLGDRYKNTGAPLTATEEGQLLRAAAAYSLASDDASLTRLRTNYTPFLAGARNPDALHVALAGLNGGDVSPAQFTKITADDQLFLGWVAQMKAHFDQIPSPHAPLTERQAAVAPPASAAPTPGKG